MKSRFWLFVAAALVLAGGLLASPARAALSDDDNACLGCHGQEGLTKMLGKDETLQLRVDGAEFEKSVHASLGCAACHGDVDLKTHPGTTKDYESLRAFSLAKAAACQQCHEDAYKQYSDSVHAKRIAAGNPLAPTCTGCHGVHGITPKTAYETCIGCHSAALEAHGKWLPNAPRHHAVVSCAACHAPAALRMVDLRLYDPAAKTWAAEKAGEPWFGKLAKSIDADGNGLDARELLELVKRINPAGTAQPKRFRGRIELRSDVEAHRLSDKSAALHACDNCHQAGSEPFHNVTVSVNGPDGRPVRHAAQPEVLRAALSVVSLPEFYAIGGTRSRVLDALFVLALLGGVGFPVGHLTVRWIARKLRSRGGA